MIRVSSAVNYLDGVSTSKTSSSATGPMDPNTDFTLLNFGKRDWVSPCCGATDTLYRDSRREMKEKVAF